MKTIALLLLIQASHLSATTATIPKTTKGKADRIFLYFKVIGGTYKLMKGTDANKQNTNRKKINTFKAKIVKLINLDEDIINQTNPLPPNEPIIIIAASYGYIDIITTLLNREANVNTKDSDGYTALMAAAMFLHLNVVELLLKAGANALLKNNKKETAFTLAIDKKLNKNQEALKKNLMNLLAAAGETQKKANEIHSYFNSLDNPNIKASSGTDLKGKISSLIISNKAIINQTTPGGRNRTIIMRAAAHNQIDIIKILLCREANVNAADRNGKTALMVAAKHHYFDLVKLLLEGKANTNVLLTNHNGKTALDLAKEDHISKPRTLKQINDKPKTIDLLAAAVETQKKANKIHSYFNSINQASHAHQKTEKPEEKLAESKKIRNYRVEIKKELKSDENIINQTNPNGHNGTILIRAAAFGYLGIIMLLFRRRPNIDATDNKGRTALMMTAMFLHLNIAKLLLRINADVFITNHNGETALDLARKDNNGKVLSKIQAKTKKKIIALLETAGETQRKAMPVPYQLRSSGHSGSKDESKNEYKDDLEELNLNSHTPSARAQDILAKVNYSSTTPEGSLKRLTPNLQSRPFIISPEIIQQLKAKKEICNITFVIFFLFVLISTPSYFYIRLKT